MRLNNLIRRCFILILLANILKIPLDYKKAYIARAATIPNIKTACIAVTETPINIKTTYVTGGETPPNCKAACMASEKICFVVKIFCLLEAKMAFNIAVLHKKVEKSGIIKEKMLKCFGKFRAARGGYSFFIGTKMAARTAYSSAKADKKAMDAISTLTFTLVI